MINGWLVVNTFMDEKKFTILYEMVSLSFLKKGVVLKIKKAQDICLEIGHAIKNKPDFVIFWDKDYYLASSLEKEGIRLFNNASALINCDNKILMYQKLQQNNINIPRTFVAPKTYEGVNYTKRDFLDIVINEIGFPMVIKEAYGSFGQQVYLAANKVQLNNIIDNLKHKDFLLQQYISSSYGKDIRINIVGNNAIVSMLRENQKDFRSNISSGGSGSLYKPKPEYVDLAVKAAHALGCDFAGVDVLFGENDEPIICEVNANPQFGSTLEVTGVNLADYICNYIIKQI